MATPDNCNEPDPATVNGPPLTVPVKFNVTPAVVMRILPPAAPKLIARSMLVELPVYCNVAVLLTLPMLMLVPAPNALARPELLSEATLIVPELMITAPVKLLALPPKITNAPVPFLVRLPVPVIEPAVASNV